MTRKAAALMLAINLLVTLAMIAAYSVWMAPKPAPRIAVLDVAELYRLKEQQVATALVKRDATDEERTLALKRVSAFGAEMTALLERLPEECTCLILARGALVGSATRLPDMTPAVRQRLKL